MTPARSCGPFSPRSSRGSCDGIEPPPQAVPSRADGTAATREDVLPRSAGSGAHLPDVAKLNVTREVDLGDAGEPGDRTLAAQARRREARRSSRRSTTAATRRAGIALPVVAVPVARLHRLESAPSAARIARRALRIRRQPAAAAVRARRSGRATSTRAQSAQPPPNSSADGCCCDIDQRAHRARSARGLRQQPG